MTVDMAPSTLSRYPLQNAIDMTQATARGGMGPRQFK
jgi:hypothetical protein